MYSLNEIEAMGRRAARGAGLAWGLAEEAGKAARWLSAHGLPGVEALAGALEHDDGRDYREVAPVSDGGLWRAPAGPLCPLAAGAALCDRAAAIAGGREIELGPTVHPLLLAPFVAAGAELAGAGLELSWAGAIIRLSPEGVAVEAGRTALAVPRAERVGCRRGGSGGPGSMLEARVAHANAEGWDRLAGLAQRTLAPATEASRLSGAGAGLTDED